MPDAEGRAAPAPATRAPSPMEIAHDGGLASPTRRDGLALDAMSARSSFDEVPVRVPLRGPGAAADAPTAVEVRAAPTCGGRSYRGQRLHRLGFRIPPAD